MTSSLPAWWPSPTQNDPNSPNLWDELKSTLDPQKYIPVRAAGIVSKEMKDGSGHHFILKNGKTHTYVRLAPQEFWVWEQIDGSKTVQNLVMAYFMQYKAFGFGAILSLIGRLRDNHMLDEKPQRLYADLSAGVQSQSFFYKLTLGARAAFTREFSIRNLDKHLERIHRNGGWILFTWPLQILYLLLSTVGLYLYYLLTSDPSYQILSLESPVQLGVIAYLPLLIHEFGHAITAKHVGCEVYKGGAMLYFGMPAVFVDTTDVWMFGKRARLAVTWAGPYTGYIIGGGLASIVYFAPGLPTQTAQAMLQVASSSILITTLNILPLLKLDGYYILSDALEIPLLRERSMEFLTRKARGKFLKKETWTREEKIFLVFGALAFLSTFYFTWGGLHFWDRQAATSITDLLNLEGEWTTVLWNIFIGALGVSSILLSIYWIAGQFKAATVWLRTRGLLSRPGRAALLIVLAALIITLLPQTLLPTLAAGLTPLTGLLAFGVSAWLFLANFLAMRGSVHRAMWFTASLGALLSAAGFADSLNPAWLPLALTLRGIGAGLSLLSILLAGRLLSGLRGAWRFVTFALWLAAIIASVVSIAAPMPAFHWHVFAGLLCLGTALHWGMRPSAKSAALVETPSTASARARLQTAYGNFRSSILNELTLDFGPLTRERVERGQYRPRGRETVGGVQFDKTQSGFTPDDYGSAFALGLEELLIGTERVGGTKYAWRALAHGYDNLNWELQEVAEEALLKYVPHAQGLSNALSVRRDDSLLLLQSIPLFAGLTDAELGTLSRSLVSAHFERGETIVAPDGNEGSLFIVRAGRAELVNSDGQVTALLSRGDHFDPSSLTSKQRGILARAVTPLEALFLDTSHTDELTSQQQRLDDKARGKIKRLGLLRRIPLFEQFEADALESMAAQLKSRRFMPGETVFQQGETGRAFYIIESGRVSVQANGQEVARLSTGEYFGEIAVFHDTPRMATVMALEDTSLLEMTEDEFDQLVAGSAGLKQAVQRVSSRRLLVNERNKVQGNGRQTAPYA